MKKRNRLEVEQGAVIRGAPIIIFRYFFNFLSFLFFHKSAITSLPVWIIERDRHNKTQITCIVPRVIIYAYIIYERNERGEFVVTSFACLSHSTAT